MKEKRHFSSQETHNIHLLVKSMTRAFKNNPQFAISIRNFVAFTLWNDLTLDLTLFPP